MPARAETATVGEAAGAGVRMAPGTPAELPGIGAVAFASAFFGAPATAFFPAETLFAELWVGPYLSDGHAVVARSGGRVVGYCLGADRPGAYLCGLLRRLPRLLAGIVRGCHPGWRRALRFGWHSLWYWRPGAPVLRYPAHLHLAVLPEFRGAGMGNRLLRAYLERARDRGVMGVQLATTDHNDSALRLFRKQGFEEWRSAATDLWRPWKRGTVRQVVMVLDLRTWPPAAATTPPEAVRD